MSSKCGRKRDDTLPPNRGRDYQRAFRARRVAHLQALEQRISELEEENRRLCQELNVPQTKRTPIGKGPTGRQGLPRSYVDYPMHPSREFSSEAPASKRDSVSSILVSATPSTRAAAQEIENVATAVGGTEQISSMSALLPGNAASSPSYPATRSFSFAPAYFYGPESRNSAPAYSEREHPRLLYPYEQLQSPQADADAGPNVVLGYSEI